ncbi:hypothetical protein [Streptosporangium fragile]|uniref:hypothetical protein n=1 Tax=Streptosporangium fragile TaxID=46186 RepID=UPI0031EF9BD1
MRAGGGGSQPRLLPGRAAELETEKAAGNSVHGQMLALGEAEDLMWVYAVAGVITLALAAPAWRWGETAKVRTIMAVGLVPYTALCHHLWWRAMDEADSFLLLYSYVASTVVNMAWLLYLAGTILLFSSGAGIRPQADQGSVSP